jgi:peptidyl-prolyl cis-trans isomerase D
MTMLDRMRRHKGWLKWSLALVCLAFVVFYIPDFLQGDRVGAAPGETVAEVEGTPITVRDFRRQLNQRMQMFRSQGGGKINEQMLKQLGIDRQVLQSMIDEQAVVAEARRLGLSVSDAEVRAYILNLPVFQENGQFVGEERYRLFLRRNGYTAEDFEDAVRRDLLSDKLQTAVTGWVTVSDAEVEEEYRRRNEKAKLAVVGFLADQFRTGVTASDADVAAHFEKNKDSYKLGERRKVRYVLVDAQTLRQKIQPSPNEVDEHYRANIDQFSNPEQVRASHILLKTEGKDEAEVRKAAEGLLAKVKAGADFASLAKQLSEDDVSKARGGDLDFFGRGSMVKPFEDAAFALAPGETSDLVKTDYGFHIIRVAEKRPAGTRPLDEVRQQITEQLKWERAQEQASSLAARLAAEIKKPVDLDRVAKAQGLTVKESNWCQRTDPIGEVGPSPQVAATAFALKEDQVSEPLTLPQGHIILAYAGRQDARLPKLDEVKDRVQRDVVEEKARAAARAKGAEVVASLKSASDFAAAAKAAGREAKTTELVARGTALPDIGPSPAVDKVAFSLPLGSVSDPIATDTGAAIIKVLERTEVTPGELATARDSLRRELVTTKRGRFFNAYLAKAKDRLDIKTYPEAVARVSG